MVIIMIADCNTKHQDIRFQTGESCAQDYSISYTKRIFGFESIIFLRPVRCEITLSCELLYLNLQNIL